jgi:hypothetical protein
MATEGEQNMSESKTVSYAVLGVLLFLGMAAVGYMGSQAAVNIKSLERSVTVKGLSEREVAADIAIWPISTQVASDDIEGIYRIIQSNNSEVIEYLKKYGIAADEITINPPTVNDLYATNYGNKEDINFRYTGTTTITVYSNNVEQVRKAMSDVIELGKKGIVLTEQNYQNRTQFLYSGLNDIKPQMIEEATKNAREVANKFAKDSNSTLGKIKSARQGQFSIADRDATTPHIKKVRVVSTVQYYLSD